MIQTWIVASNYFSSHLMLRSIKSLHRCAFLTKKLSSQWDYKELMLKQLLPQWTQKEERAEELSSHTCRWPHCYLSSDPRAPKQSGRYGNMSGLCLRELPGQAPDQPLLLALLTRSEPRRTQTQNLPELTDKDKQKRHSKTITMLKTKQ